MRYVNPQGVPEPIARAVIKAQEGYERDDADFTVTELLKPPQAVHIARQHEADLEMDVADGIYSLFGVVMARILAEHDDDLISAMTSGGAKLRPEQLDILISAAKEFLKDVPRPEDVMTERRLRVTLDVPGHGLYVVSGQFDRVAAVRDPSVGWKAWDWKVANIWEAILGSKIERVQQLNMYRVLLEANGYKPVVELGNGFLFRNWERPRAYRERDYPQSQFLEMRQPLWPINTTVDFMRQRIELHLRARDGERIPCTMEERWQQPTKYAVIKRGQKRAIRGGVMPSLERAEEVRNHQKRPAAYDIVERPSEPKRCQMYCSASPWCPQFADIRMATAEPIVEETAEEAGA